jgi:CRP/FNR family nitrogen fixation transcriptional regulator
MPAHSGADPATLGGTPRRLAQNEALFKEGEGADWFYKINSGCLRTARFLKDGRRQIDSFHFSGDILGLEYGGKYRGTAEAVTEVGLSAYRRECLDSPSEIDQAVREEAIAGALRSLGRAQSHILLLGRKSAAERIAGFLLEMSERIAGGGDTFSLPMERADIADHLGTSTETVSRVLTRFARLKLIDMRNYYLIGLRDRQALAEMILDRRVRMVAKRVASAARPGTSPG